MKRFLLPGILYLSIACPVKADNTNTFWFPVGEKISYSMYWGIIPVGDFSMWTEWVKQDGKDMIAIKAQARSAYVVSKIYPVDDYVESLVDPETFLPVKYTQILHEGKRIRNDLVMFCHTNGVAVWQSAKQSVTNAPKEIKIDKDTRDVLSLAYFMRSKGMTVGQTNNFRVIVDDKIYDLSVAGVKEENQKAAGVGKIKTLVVEPKAKFGEIFVRKGRVLLWFSQDTRHICTRMEAIMTFANLKAILTGVTGPGDDKWAESSKGKKDDKKK